MITLLRAPRTRGPLFILAGKIARRAHGRNRHDMPLNRADSATAKQRRENITTYGALGGGKRKCRQRFKHRLAKCANTSAILAPAARSADGFLTGGKQRTGMVLLSGRQADAQATLSAAAGKRKYGRLPLRLQANRRAGDHLCSCGQAVARAWV